ncbi:MAG: alpha/beta fold hydrolase [Hydrogenophaga sp.]|uniref:alpha/beta fold hydrolase n=1 Tax=Hydrogenophaga sp. TaxID=1904254 RepID=UPI00271E7AAE|nr:alpha/beta fold hydrolase [Hydrogenophaga sp.]MDO9571342.1 alpha/beta fold hydrolase [Hydrogenophaga sp.]MDP3376448.1 alpha/beta fold hydrolase [Hydrogenophaga sp.]
MSSNINATKPPPRDNPERVQAAGGKQGWPPPRFLAVGRGHRMAWRTVGNPAGAPWLLLHGGPGSSCQPGMLAPLDLARQWAIAPDQRGCGASRPRGQTTANTTQALVADLEALRVHLGLERWSVLAGSWGTVVALAYAQAHPQRVQRLVLRGAFALRRREVGGLLLPAPGVLRTLGAEPHWPGSAGHAVPPVLARLRQLLQSGTPGVAPLRVLRRWNLLETAAAGRGMRRSLRHAMQAPCLTGPAAQPPAPSAPLAPAIRRGWAALQRQQRRALARVQRPGADQADRRALRKFRIQAHYLLHRGFVRPGELDRAVLRLAEQGIRVDWVHGRFDAICPPANSRRWAALGPPHAAYLQTPCSGHLGHEPGLLAALRATVRNPC